MKIQVMRADGKKEVLTLAGPIKIRETISLNVLCAADGIEYFFTQDGRYDGWGMHLPTGMEQNEAAALAAAIEGSREVSD